MDCCFVCQSSSKPTKVACWRPGAVYRITCRRCLKEGVEGVYWGESGFSAYFCGKQHLEGLATRFQDNVLYRHCLEEHGGAVLTREDFEMTVVSNHRRAITRQSEKGVRISDTVRRKEMGERIILINSKAQFFQPGLVKANYSPVQ